MVAIVYILYSKSLDKFYIGLTFEAIEERLRKHLSSLASFTSKTVDWEVMYTEEYS